MTDRPVAGATRPAAGAPERASRARWWDTVRLHTGWLMHEEHGDIVTSWLRQMLVIMAVLGFLGYEGLSMAVTAITLDDAAEHVADEAADTITRDATEEDVIAAAEAEAEDRGVEITSLEVDVEDRVVTVTVTRQAGTVVAHRIPGIREWTMPSATRRSAWRP